MKNYYEELEDKLNPIFFNDLKKNIKTLTFKLNLIFLFIVNLFIIFLLMVRFSAIHNSFLFFCTF